MRPYARALSRAKADAVEMAPRQLRQPLATCAGMRMAWGSGSSLHSSSGGVRISLKVRCRRAQRPRRKRYPMPRRR